MMPDLLSQNTSWHFVDYCHTYARTLWMKATRNPYFRFAKVLLGVAATPISQTWRKCVCIIRCDRKLRRSPPIHLQGGFESHTSEIPNSQAHTVMEAFHNEWLSRYPTRPQYIGYESSRIVSRETIIFGPSIYQHLISKQFYNISIHVLIGPPNWHVLYSELLACIAYHVPVWLQQIMISTQVTSSRGIGINIQLISECTFPGIVPSNTWLNLDRP